MQDKKQKILEIGGKQVLIDIEVYDLVALLNKYYKPTVACCSGHGFQPASIIFEDDTEIRIMTFEQSREVDKLFQDINGVK